MRRFPPSALLAAVTGILVGACDRGGNGPADDVPQLPFPEAPLPADSFRMVNAAGDTLLFHVSEEEAGTRLARYRRVAAGVDSMVALIDPHTKAPLSSFWRLHIEGGSLSAEVLYGEGFDGQARLTLTSPDGEREENVRTPPPILDSAQIPLGLSALDLVATDSVDFNYVAPFEGRALPARLLIFSDTLEAEAGNRPAFRLRLLVSGLEERYWLEAEPPHRLLRIEEVTRNVSWHRP